MIDRYCTKSMDLGMFLSILILLLSHHMLTNWEVQNTSTRLLSNSTLFCTRFDLQSFILLLSSSILNPWQGCWKRNSGPIGHTICFWITRMPCCSSWCFTKKWFTNTILTQKEMGAYEGTTIPLPNETAILDCWRIESAKPFKSQTTRPSVSSHCVWIQAATELTIKILLIVLLDPTLGGVLANSNWLFIGTECAHMFSRGGGWCRKGKMQKIPNWICQMSPQTSIS